MKNLDAILLALAMVESGNNHNAVGKDGERTAWQIHPVTWQRFARKDIPIETATPQYARVVALSVWIDNKVRFKWIKARDPIDSECYMMWRMGFAGAKRRGFNINRCSKAFRDQYDRWWNLKFMYSATGVEQ